MKLKTENKNHSRTIWTLQKQVIQMAQFVEIELNNDPNAAKYRDNILKKIKEAHDQDKIGPKRKEKKLCVKDTITRFIGFRDEGTI